VNRAQRLLEQSMRSVKRIVFIVGLAICCSASACLNDSEVADHEREFRSQYLDAQGTMATTSEYADRTWLISASGATLLLSAIAITLYSNR
jgi:hypothetical protein